MDHINSYLEGVNLTLPYETEYANAYSHANCLHLTHLLDEVASRADNGYYPYPVKIAEIYDDNTLVAFADTGELVKYVLCGEEESNGVGDRRWYSWVEVYLMSPNGSWIQMQEPEMPL